MSLHPSDHGPDSDHPSVDRARGARTTMDALSASPDVFEAFFDSARIGLALADLAGRYVRVNHTYGQLVGRAPEDLVGVHLLDVVGNVSSGPLELTALVSGQEQTLQSEASQLHHDGRMTWLLHGVSTVAGGDGSPGWLAVSAQDITERRHAELELRALTDALTEQAVRDPLTGLANRALLEERLRSSLARDARTGTATALLFLDLDGFKQVNDRHGHAVGDAVLRSVAERLTGVVRPSDTVARLGGDEFVVLVESSTPHAVDVLVPRVEAAVHQPILVGARSLRVGVSVGVATSSAGEEDPAGLLAAADAQMYRAKRAR